MFKKCLLITALIALLFSSPSMADEMYYGGLNGVAGGYVQAQGGIDLYLENAAIAAGPIAGSANIVYMQVSGQIQLAGAIATPIESYEHCNESNLEIEKSTLEFAAEQYQEKITILSTGYGQLQMSQMQYQSGHFTSTSIKTSLNFNRYNDIN